ncbi:UNVERIFIED_ORG: TolB-like protein [Rhizobium esperanzae]
MAVEEGNLTVQIAQLRKLLGPAAGGGEWIVTVPRIGYRFTGAIHRLGSVKRKALPLPDKPSIAVLPFLNIGSDPEQDSFADGLTEDLITDLSRMPGLFVIARNSVFAYKGRAIDMREVADELGVRYLLEGSARRAAGRVRVNAKLVDTVSGDHLWAVPTLRCSSDGSRWARAHSQGIPAESLSGKLVLFNARPGAICGGAICGRRRDVASRRDLSDKLAPFPGGKPCPARSARRGAGGDRTLPCRQPRLFHPPLGGDRTIPRRSHA